MVTGCLQKHYGWTLISMRETLQFDRQDRVTELFLRRGLSFALIAFTLSIRPPEYRYRRLFREL